MSEIERLQPHEGTQFPTTKEMRQRAYDLLAPLAFDTTVSYVQFTEALGLNPANDDRARRAVLQAGRDILKSHNKKLVNVKTEGYRILRPNEQSHRSDAEARRGRRQFKRALETATFVAMEHLTPAEIADTLQTQARRAIEVALTKKIGRAKELPPSSELHLPSSSKLVEMMRRPPKGR